MKVKLNVALHGYQKGDIVNLGKKPNQYWRRRIKDSKIDNCLELIKNNQAPKKTKSKGSLKHDNNIISKNNS